MTATQPTAVFAMSDGAKSTITMIATMVIAVAAIIGVTLGVLAPAIESNRREIENNRQEIRETRTELLRAIEKSEKRVLDAVGGHSHDADGNPRFNRPVSHEGAE